MIKRKFKVGDIIQYNWDKSIYRVRPGVPGYYVFDYLSFETHGSCILRQAGHRIPYVNREFTLVRKQTPLEKALE